MTFNPTNDFPMGTDYYVEVDTNAIQDLAGNFYEGITNKTTWNFTTVYVPDDGPRLLLYDSFESPDITGKQVTTAPDNWVRTTVDFYSGRCGMADTNSGVFTTPRSAV